GERVAGHDPEAELERLGHDLAQAPDPHRDHLDPAPSGVALDGREGGRRDRELVHQAVTPSSDRIRAIVSSTISTARSTDPATCSLSPSPISSTTAGSQATTTTRPGQPPTALTKRSTVRGSIPCGSMTSPSSMAPPTEASSTSITYSVPGSPPWRLTSTRTRAW